MTDITRKNTGRQCYWSAQRERRERKERGEKKEREERGQGEERERKCVRGREKEKERNAMSFEQNFLGELLFISLLFRDRVIPQYTAKQ